jgi:hypothetical protein
MATTREQLHVLIEALPDDQVEVVLAVAEALRKGRAVVSACELMEIDEDRAATPQ